MYRTIKYIIAIVVSILPTWSRVIEIADLLSLNNKQSLKLRFTALSSAYDLDRDSLSGRLHVKPSWAQIPNFPHGS